MGKLRWYKRDPDAALGGMMGLNLEERGAYNTVLDLIYSHDDQLADDDHFIAGWCQCDVRVWKRIKASLIVKKKLATSGGLLRNFRATSEVFHGLRRIDQAREAGGIGGRKSHAVRSDNNSLDEASAQATAQANVKRPLDTSTSTPTPTEEEMTTAPAKPSPTNGAQNVRQRKATESGTRLDSHWLPNAEDRAFAEQLGLNADVTGEEFRDYWIGIPGSRGRKLDWSATYRNRCREVAGRSSRGGAHNGRRADQQGSDGSIVTAVTRVIARRGLA